MANTLKFGNGQWATKKGSTLAYNDENGNFKPLPFNFERSTSATRVNKQGLIEVVTNNKPRIDFKDDANGALLLEPQRSNLFPYSEAISNSSPKSGTFVDNFAISPDGTQNATKLTAINTDPYFYQSVAVGSGDYTISVYVKGIGSTIGKEFLLILGSGINSTPQTITGEWKRFTFSGTLSAGTTIRGLEIPNPAVSGDELLVWGLQLEQGSYPTSYIPTNGATVTRLKDEVNNSVLDTANVMQGNNWTFVFEKSLTSDNLTLSSDDAVFLFKDTSVLKFSIERHRSNTLRVYNYLDGAYMTILGGTWSDEFQFAITYDNGLWKFYRDGVEIDDYTEVVAMSIDELNISCSSGMLLLKYFYSTNTTEITF